MKKIIIGLLALGTISVMASENYLYECHTKAIQAARAIDMLNFELSDRSSIIITERSQKKNTSKIDVAFSDSKNRSYTVKLSKNRSASLRGNTIIEESGCFVDSVDAN